ncbi:MAG TPA: helix-turn-helix transcriptional regulator [Vicinamibacterales bacterium]|nr:helix-turn-helix transcriptional regulator [Vicinamibacterales bacterium]
MSNPSNTEVKLRFRIKMLLAERDMTVAQLFERVKSMGLDVSSSHFYRQMKPYADPVRLDLLTAVVKALKVPPSDLFDLVEVAETADGSEPMVVPATAAVPKPIDEAEESEKVRKARKTAKVKRELALLGSKISVLPTKK